MHKKLTRYTEKKISRQFFTEIILLAWLKLCLKINKLNRINLGSEIFRTKSEGKSPSDWN